MRLLCLVTVFLAADALVEDLQLADDARKPFNLSPFDSVWSPCSDCSEFDGCLQFGHALKGKLLRKTRTATVGECIKACDNCADCNGIKYFALVEKCYLMQSEGNSTANKWFASLMITCLEKPATTTSTTTVRPSHPCFRHHMDLVGEDVHSLNAPDAESCARHCYVTAECDSFTFLNYGCYLKRKPTSSRYLKDSVSAELSCIFPGATTTPCCPECFEYNVDFFGNDFYTCNVASPQLCRTICSAKVECKAFTFKETTAPVNCYLKRSDSGRVQIQGAISGYPCWSN